MKRILLFSILVVPSSSILAHGEASVGRPGVGADKGVIKADEDEGFVLHPSAAENFAIKIMPLKIGPNWTVPRQALVYSGLEIQVFRQRDGYWKTVDVKIVRKTAANVDISSSELKAGDQLAIDGIGFLKIIEQSVFGPASEGHGHGH